jgi:hypothetical protein
MARKTTIREERKYREILDKLNKGMEVSDIELEFLDKITDLKVKEVKKNKQ